MTRTIQELEHEIGRRYGRLVVLSFSKMNLKSERLYHCKCDCGKVRDFNWVRLKSGKAQSCGCLAAENARNRLVNNAIHTTHGYSGTPTYRTWKQMKERVKETYHERKYYFDKGITVCDRWLHSFENFLSDMGERPKGMTIDRIDGSKKYEPSNCRWADAVTQSRNRDYARKGLTR